MSESLYLEDVFAGQRFITGLHPLTEDEIKAFAAPYDPQPFHTDAEAAKDSFFGGLAASGLAHRRHHHAAAGGQRPARWRAA